MRKLRKKFVMVAFLLALGAVRGTSLFAQWAVLDVANLMNGIEQVYQFYQEIQNTIEQVQNTYKQIDQAAQQMKTINFDDMKDLGKNFDGMKDNPFEVITGVHNSAQDLTREVNKQMNKVNDLQDALTKESISFGGVKYSMADLCGATTATDKKGNSKNIYGFVNNAWNHTKETADKAAAGYEGKLTYKEKQAIMRHFGMSPRNYASLELGKYELARLTTTSNLLGTEKALEDNLNDIIAQQSTINELSQKLPDGSIYAATQMTNSTLGTMLRQLGLLNNTLNRTAALSSQKIANDEFTKAVMAEEAQKKREREQKALANNGMDVDELNQM